MNSARGNTEQHRELILEICRGITPEICRRFSFNNQQSNGHHMYMRKLSEMEERAS